MVKRIFIPLISNLIIFFIAAINLIERNKSIFTTDVRTLDGYYKAVLSLNLHNQVQIALLVCSLLIAAFYVFTNYFDDQKRMKLKNIKIKLVRPIKPDKMPDVKMDPNLIDGNLKIILDFNGIQQVIFQRLIRYGELINQFSAEVHYEEKVNININKKKLKNAKFVVLYEPIIDSVWTRNLYDRDNLLENLFDAQLTDSGMRQLLVYTEGIEKDVYLTRFDEPNKVLSIQTNVQPYDETLLPNIFKIPDKIVVDIDAKYHATIEMSKLQFVHDYCIMAVLDKYIEKQLLQYSIRAELMVSSISNDILKLKVIKLKDIELEKSKAEINNALTALGVDFKI